MRAIGFKSLVAMYATIAILTFGRAAHEEERYLSAHCATPGERLSVGESCYVSAPMNGMMAAVFWPLYWSWTAWS